MFITSEFSMSLGKLTHEMEKFSLEDGYVRVRFSRIKIIFSLNYIHIPLHFLQNL